MIAIIPAKSTSHRLPGKNKLELGGVPLWKLAALAASESGLFDKTIVSTDDPALEDAATWETPQYVCGEWRYGWLADPSRTTFELCRHIMRNESADELCLLLPTSPLRTPEDIKDAYAAWKSSKSLGLYSVGPDGKHDGHVLFMKTEDIVGSRFSDWPIYLMQKWQTPAGRSLDVNVQEDFDRAKAIVDSGKA